MVFVPALAHCFGRKYNGCQSVKLACVGGVIKFLIVEWPGQRGQPWLYVRVSGDQFRFSRR